MARKLITPIELIFLIEGEIAKIDAAIDVSDFKIFRAEPEPGCQNWTVAFAGGDPSEHEIVASVIRRLGEIYDISDSTTLH